MWRRILGADWTLEEELTIGLDLVRRLKVDMVGRLIACLTVAALVAYSASIQLAALWIVLVFLNEFTELKLNRRMRDERLPPRARLVPYLVHISLGSALWTCMCLVLWGQGDFVDKLTAGAILVGILIHCSLFYSDSRLQSLVTGVPALLGAAVMIASASTDPFLTDRERTVACVALFTLSAYLAFGVYMGVRTRERLRSFAAKTARLAAQDPLTGLHNRRSFFEAVEAHANSRAKFIVAFLDLDRFKPLNDEFGHAFGDQVLTEVARRLEQSPGVLAAARMGGDEFAVLCAAPSNRDAATRFMSSLHDRVAALIRCDAGVVSVGASMGWVRAEAVTGPVSEIIHSADVAMRRAKTERVNVAEFDPVTDSTSITSSALEIAFSQALATGRIRAALQPIVSATCKSVVSMELLVRWPESGFARDPAPLEFIPVAERLGLLNEMLWTTLRQALPSLVGTSWSLAINVSPSQLTSSYFLPKLCALLEQHGVSPGRIELEVTEQVTLRNVAENCAVLSEARALGFRIVLDDFGTGYSSLAMLDRLPLDKIKLDQAFVEELKDRAETQKILKATVSLAHELGMKCSVEGIESAETAEIVTAFGCDQLQGYWVGRPEILLQAPVFLKLAS